MDLPIEVTLKRPITVDDVTVDKLSFDEPDLATTLEFAELKAELSEKPTPRDAARVGIFWIARLASVSEKIAGKIKESDLDAINMAVGKILSINDDDEGDGDAPGNEDPAK